MTPLAKAQVVKALGGRIGFDLVGVTHAGPVRRAEYYRRWLAAGYGGGMGYLRRNVPYRAEPGKLLAGARSVICVAVNCRRADGHLRPGALDAGAASGAESPPTGLVAQYARGRDYHTLLRDMLDTLLEQVRGELGETFDARVFADTGPVLERELAVAAGLGWFGRNTCLLNGRLGSYLLLGEALTTLELAADEPVGERCGSCRRCVEACPTGALVAPYELDARRCIAYLTIEHRGAIAEELQPLMGDHVFGCDVCQQVCPYNAKAPLATHPDMTADVLPARLDLSRLVQMGAGEYRRLTRGSAAARARPSMWRRNAALALANVARCHGRVGREGETPDARGGPRTADRGGGMTRIKITLGALTVSGTLNDSQTARLLATALPFDSRAQRWGDEVYFSTPVAAGEEQAQAEVPSGTIAYWPPGKALCLFFGQTPYSPVNVVGQLEGEAKVLATVKDGERVRVEPA